MLISILTLILGTFLKARICKILKTVILWKMTVPNELKYERYDISQVNCYMNSIYTKEKNPFHF